MAGVGSDRLIGSEIHKFYTLQEKAAKVVLNPEKCEVKDWRLAVETIVKMGIKLLDTETRSDLIMDLLDILEKSVKDLMENDMEPFLLQGLSYLESYLSRYKN